MARSGQVSATGAMLAASPHHPDGPSQEELSMEHADTDLSGWEEWWHRRYAERDLAVLEARHAAAVEGSAA